MIKSSSTTTIFRTSLLCLSLVYFGLGQSLDDVTRTSGIPAVDRAKVAKELSATIGEHSFWTGIQLPTAKLHAIIFDAQKTQENRDSDFDVLAIVPDINATYRYRLCEQRAIPVGRTEGWLTWLYSDANRVGADEYGNQVISQFHKFIAHAKRSDETLTIASGSAALFRVHPELKATRLAEIQRAAGELFHKRPLRLLVANFSETTEQINALAPGLGEMVTFSVNHSCAAKDRVEVGREVPLKPVRPELRARIEANSTILTLR